MEVIFLYSVIYSEEFASHLQHHHAGIAAMIPMSRSNIHTCRCGLVSACQACETVFEREMQLFLARYQS